MLKGNRCRFKVTQQGKPTESEERVEHICSVTRAIRNAPVLFILASQYELHKLVCSIKRKHEAAAADVPPQDHKPLLIQSTRPRMARTDRIHQE
jgi:hypothetical protein